VKILAVRDRDRVFGSRGFTLSSFDISDYSLYLCALRECKWPLACEGP
jgi:hypothetical protein